MRDTLVLNASFEPLSTVTLNRAVVLVLQDKAVVEQAHPGLRVRAAAVDLPVPRVIRLCRYVTGAVPKTGAVVEAGCAGTGPAPVRVLRQAGDDRGPRGAAVARRCGHAG